MGSGPRDWLALVRPIFLLGVFLGMATLPSISRRGLSLLAVLFFVSVSVWHINLSATSSSWRISLPRLGVGQKENQGDEWDVFPADEGLGDTGDVATDESLSKASDHLVIWRNGIPKTKVRAHVPGQTSIYSRYEQSC